jgi:hypothetical protein
MHVAESTIFLVAAMTLATFNITPIVKDGKPVPPVARSAPGFIWWALSDTSAAT